MTEETKKIEEQKIEEEEEEEEESIFGKSSNSFPINILLSILSFILFSIDRLIYYYHYHFDSNFHSNLPHDLKNFGNEKFSQFSIKLKTKDSKLENLYNNNKQEEEEEEEEEEEHHGEEKEKEGEYCYRNKLYGNGGKDLISSTFQKVKTMKHFFKHLTSKYSNKRCWGSREVIGKIINKEGNKVPKFSPFKWYSFKQCDERIDNYSKGMQLLTGIKPKGRLGIYENTCIEWILNAHSAWRKNLTCVTVYSTLGIKNVLQALNESKISVLFTNEEKLKILLENKINEKCPLIKSIIYKKTYPHDKQLIDKFQKDTNMKLFSFDEVESIGKDNNDKNDKNKNKKNDDPIVTPEDLALIMYTSGTTGNPKGVLIPHRSIIGAIFGLSSISFKPNYNQSIVQIGYLPLAHIFAIGGQHYVLSQGGCVGFGSPKTLFDKGAHPIGDLNAIKPNFMCGVPRVYSTIKKNIVLKINDKNQTSPIKRWLVKTAFHLKEKAFLKGYTTPLLDGLVFKKFKELLGGNIQILITGGGPINPSTHKFVRICFGVPVCQGYGLTETGASLAVQRANAPFSTGNCGTLSPSGEVKLVSCLNGKYTINDKPCPRGEIVIRGYNVAKGYYLNEKETKESFKNGGWFHTGDIGLINKDGTLSVIDRKKNLIKLQRGEYIALEKLESLYGASKFISPNGICIFGNSKENFIVGNVVPDLGYLEYYSIQNNIFNDKNFDVNEACKNEKIKEAILKDLLSLAKKENLEKFEYLKDIRIHNDVWSTETNCLTAASKLKRRFINEKYKDSIKEMYKLNKTTYRSLI